MHRNNEISLENRLPVLFVDCCGKKKSFLCFIGKRYFGFRNVSLFADVGSINNKK